MENGEVKVYLNSNACICFCLHVSAQRQTSPLTESPLIDSAFLSN